MTATEYINRGFNVSAHIEQQVIDRAESDVRQAYIVPIVGDVTCNEVVNDALANLAYLQMMKSSVFFTRSGAKTKRTNDSDNADVWQALQQQAQVCAMKIEALRQVDGANKQAKVTDICGIYFNTNFLNL